MRPKPRLTWLAACAALGLLAGPASAAFITYDLTGNWTGTITCNESADGVKQKTVTTTTMEVSQAGVNFGIRMGTGLATRFYAGLANADAKKPTAKGEAALALCGTDNALGAGADELVRITVSKADKLKASIKGFSHFSGPLGPGPHFGTCKWKFTRVDQNASSLGTKCVDFQSIVAGGAK